MKNNGSFFKKTTAAVLMTAVLISAAAFAPSSVNSDLNSPITAAAAEQPEKIDKSSMRWVSTYGNLRLDVPRKHLDPEKIYKNLTYTKEMFSGTYSVPDVPYSPKDESDKRGENFAKGRELFQLGSNNQVTYMPYKFMAGSSVYDGECRLYFMNEKGNSYMLKGDLEIKGHSVVFKPDTTYYKDLSDMTYDFEFGGGKLTLSHGKESVELTADTFCDTDEWRYFSVNKKANKNERVDNIEKIFISKSSTTKFPHFSLTLEGGKNDGIQNVAGYFYENGLFNFSWSDSDGTIHAYEFVYFYCGNDGLILTDGTNIYKYTQKP